MGVERLDGVREKLIRADEHLHSVVRAEAEYIVTEEFGISTRWEAHIPEKSGRSGTTWRANLKPPPPLRIAVLCGDFVHNLRSALDHVARALVLENGGTPSDDPSGPVTQFPVVEDRLTRDDKIRSLEVVGGISPAAVHLLESVQPYQRVDDPTLHPLWILNHLWNVDKHRTLNVVGVNLGKVTISFSDGRNGYARAAPFEDGRLIFWVLDETPEVDHNATSTVEYAPSLALRDVAGGADKDPVPVVDLLRQLRDYVRYEVVAPFARVCFGGELPLPDPVVF